MSHADNYWSSHLGALSWALPKTTGPVVEFGGGWYSTPLLHGFCESIGREMWTVESDPAWINQIIGWKTSWHHFVLQEDLNNLVLPFDGKAGLVFIDHAGLTRAKTLQAVQGRTQLAVVHDAEPLTPDVLEKWGDTYPGIQEALGKWAYRFTFGTFPRWTVVVSDETKLESRP